MQYLRRVVEATAIDSRGIGWTDDETGELVTYHVTDNPEAVLRLIRRGAPPMAAYGERGATSELGAGLYTSGVPDYWMSRARGKWSFLDALDRDQVEAIYRKLGTEIRRQREAGRITASEETYAMGLLDAAMDGKTELMTQLAVQPYSIPFWKPSWLEPLGIAAGAAPRVLELRVVGRFGEMEYAYPPSSVLRELRRRGLAGAFTRMGMGTNPEMVIWDVGAIMQAAEAEWRT